MESIKSSISRVWPVEVSPGETLIVHGAGSRAYLHIEVTLAERGIFRLLLDYSDVELAKSLVELIADDSELVVDNDFGTVLPGNEFVAKVKSNKGWNWRTD